MFTGATTIQLNSSEVKATIAGIDDIAGDSDNQFQLRWNLSLIPSSKYISSASMCLYIDSVTGAVDNDITYWRITNQTWDASLSTAGWDAQTTTNETNTTMSSISASSYACIEVNQAVITDYDDGNDYSSVRLADPDASWDGTAAMMSAVLALGDDGGSVLFVFQGTGDANKPYMVVTYSDSLNTAPEITLPLITPTIAYTTTNLTANTTYTDADNDNGTVTFFWYMNNTNILNESFFLVINNTVLNSTFGAGNYSKNDLINVSVQANDGTANSTLQNSTTLTIRNSLVWDETFTYKSTPHHINLALQLNATDADGDTLTWKDNTTLFNINSAGFISDNPTIAEAGEYNIRVNVTDGAIVLEMNFTYNITNAAPTQPTISTANGTVFTPSNINLVYNSTDANADNLSFYVYLDGVLNMTTSNTSIAIPLSARTDQFNLTVRATDGYLNSTDADSYFFVKVTVLESAAGGSGSAGAGYVGVVEPINNTCPVGTVITEDGMCRYPEDTECGLELDKSTYVVGDKIRASFSCPQYIGLKYIISWKNSAGGILFSEVGIVMPENSNVFKPENSMTGIVEVEIPSQKTMTKEFRVFPEGWFLEFTFNNRDYKIPNFGRIIAGDRTSEYVGWGIFILLIVLLWALLLSLPDKVEDTIKKKKQVKT